LRQEQYAVSLALIVEGRIEVALLGCPNLAADSAGTLGAVFSAVRGGGSWVVPLDDTTATPVAVHCSYLADPIEARFCESVESSHTSTSLSSRVAEALGIHREPIRMDSQAKYAIVACGDADIYMRLPAKYGYKEKIWDHAGGVLVVEEAGGCVSDVMGRPLEFNHGYELLANRGIVAANRELHPRVIAALTQIYKTFPAPQGPLPAPGWTPS
jgi:3'(2'), 5'-bisphosphate nucleotidase